ncbi:winged helix-turn-helix transcriptional regulator [Maridesulfovibrio sp. FT414]|uniref:winged helix-turn-helix transcriptional regulator n=1 Tax=Maridesulfovibrio sp. FT414 TaxID=2979469 RepID=UPI003D80599A
MIRKCPAKKIGNKEYRCFFELSLQVLGGKWKPIIVYHLARCKVLRYGELRRTLDGISERMLVRQLKELEDDGVVFRKAYPEVPPRVEYSLTDIGKKLLPILLSLREWGIEYERHLGGGELVFDPDEYESLQSPFEKE